MTDIAAGDTWQVDISSTEAGQRHDALGKSSADIVTMLPLYSFSVFRTRTLES
ncbi:hypothetical protein [Pseudomonas sp. 9.1(2019)]|uniref:hypothetical protein n=1 Tax=Pseudomonas sp. 9.1(2019) TaxID=2580568 RepID=UPI0013713063|nr:hypothetical protein [Pseudomonas sp. 9.1(2019)]